MSRFDRIYEATCLCCKADGADVPEVEAAIRLLSPPVLAAYASAVDALIDAILLVEIDGTTKLAALLTAYVTISRQRNWQLLPPETVRAVERVAQRVARVAAEHNRLPTVEGPAGAAVDQLQVLLRDRIERAVEAIDTTAPGFAQALVEASGPSPSTEALRTQLEQSLDAEQAVRPLLDAWAYQTYNAGAIRAAAADGHNFIQLSAKIDASTTMFCRLVDGRIVPMARALGQLDRIEQATAQGDTAALVSAAPFHPDPKRATQADVDAAIERGGLAPFHHGCRTKNIPIRLTQPT